jgi:retinol dehydrogenase-13
MTEDKNVLVTGATGAIGSAICETLAGQGYRVFLLGRNQSKTAELTSRISDRTTNRRTSYVTADVSRYASIRELASGWDIPLHILINNAAVTPRNREETPQGIELQFATNVLGYFWMMDRFTPHLEQAAHPRIINVASYWAGGLELEDLEFQERPYHNDAAYRQSKQADRMLSKAFADRLESKGITVNSCHPGDVSSTLSRNLGFGGHETPAQAADTPVWLATSPEVRDISGKYFEHRARVTCPFSKNQTQVEALYRICREYA